MKSKIINVLFLFLIIISITGCSRMKKDLNLNINNTDNSKISDTSVTTSVPTTMLDNNSENIDNKMTSNNLVLETYKEVLQNKIEFFSADNNKKLYLNDFLKNKGIYDTIFNVTNFTVLDMEGDKIVVLELSVGDDPKFYEVLHYMNDTVYGYLIVYRGLVELKVDGTFIYSNGAADNGIGKLKFNKDVYEPDILGYSKSNQGNDNLILSYSIHNKPVTKESYDSFVDEQLEKKDVVWYEFSHKNIETELSRNP